MVNIYKSKAKAKSPLSQVELTVERWDHEAQGIGYHQGKICFIDGALPGETVRVQLTEHKASHSKGRVLKVLNPALERIAPVCRFAGTCGGCQLHYVDASNAHKLKQQGLEHLLRHQLKLQDIPWQPTLTANAQGYRRKARIGVWYDQKTRQFTVGFRRSASYEITPVSECYVLSPVIAPIFAVLTATLPQLKQGSAITHVEVLDADGQAFVIVRHVKALTIADRQLLCEAWPNACWIGQPDSGALEHWQGKEIWPRYTLTIQPNSNLQLSFKPTDFIQVNATINQAMVQQALDWLDPQPGENILDLYCGIGNFSLAFAQAGARVVGIEGMQAMVDIARANAEQNHLAQVEFAQADLHLPWPATGWTRQTYHKVVLDPARAGALGAMEQIVKLKPAQVLYVSCHPTTFARDAKVLLDKGYRLIKISLMDMFPFTSHLELMALFQHTRQ